MPHAFAVCDGSNEPGSYFRMTNAIRRYSYLNVARSEHASAGPTREPWQRHIREEEALAFHMLDILVSPQASALKSHGTFAPGNTRSNKSQDQTSHHQISHRIFLGYPRGRLLNMALRFGIGSKITSPLRGLHVRYMAT